jgi:hypothetical protein
MRTYWLPLLFCAACAPDTKVGDDTDPIGSDGDADTDADSDADADADTDTDTDTDLPCTATLTGLSPADGAVDVAIDTPVVATFSAAVTAADIALDNGVSGSVVVADDGMSAVFTADGLLDRDTTYTATASVCDSSLSSSFTTLGDALEVDPTGRTYDIELDDSSDLTWVHPSFGSFLAGDLETTDILLMVQSADDSELDVVGAAGFDFNGTTQQYPCTYAIDFDPTSFASSPAFAIGPLDTEMNAGGVSFDVYGLALSGRFSTDAEDIEDAVLTGLLDTRNISDSMGVDVCDLAVSFGDSCTTCPDGEELCLDLEIHDADAPWRSGLIVNPDLDPSRDPHCD